MSILLQILILITAMATLYAVFVHNRDVFKKMGEILPDFKKLIPVGETHHESAYVKVVVVIPDSHSENVRKEIAEAGGGIVGHYSACSFSSLGTGRYIPEPGSRPFKGSIGHLEVADEERIEVTVARANLQNVIHAIKKASPYEETLIDIYSLEAMPGDSTSHA